MSARLVSFLLRIAARGKGETLWWVDGIHLGFYVGRERRGSRKREEEPIPLNCTHL